ncbi:MULTISPECIES: hypothetical protein [unclassified Dysgonomonas]|uniref:hypothetical protein n=1 Tax=unclassified Dysgonomonas TaxID=2630389 RepID=UPI002475194C|nr:MULTISPECIES: hypothetical protein [unclassified Dysgonomonas]
MSNLIDTQKTNYNIFLYFSFLVISFIFLALQAYATSPFYVGYGGDSANYLVMGKMILAGKIPYIDFFDHKGPMMFFIEAFGQMFVPDRLGIFIMEVVNLSIIQAFIFFSARLFLNKTYSFAVVLFSLLFFAFTMEGGNLTEEYALLFSSLAFFLTLKFALSENNRVKPFHVFLIGVCAAFMMWIRLNNMGVACACTIFIFIVTIKNKDWKGLKNLFIYFILGFVAVTLPLIIYFLVNDALGEMLFAAIIYNFTYVGINESLSPFRDLPAAFFYILKAWVPFLILVIGTILHYREKKNYKVILLSALLFVFGYITTHIGAAYYHYMTLNIPCFALGLIYIFRTLKNKKTPITVCVLAAVILSGFAAHKYKSQGGGAKTDYYKEQAKELVALIPESQRDSIFAYQTMTRFHATAGVLPYYKNFMMQEWQGKYNPDIITGINQMMENNPPKWVFTQFRDQSTNKEFWKIIDQKFYLYKKNHVFELYRLKDADNETK